MKCQKQNKCSVIVSVDDNKMVRTMVKTGYGLWMQGPFSSILPCHFCEVKNKIL